MLFSLLWLCFLLPESSFAQQSVTILHADRLVGGTADSQEVRRLIGNVHLKSKNIDMRCDSAYQFLNSDELRAFGNIEVRTKNGWIWADTAIYHTKSKISTFRGRVVIFRDDVTIFNRLTHYDYVLDVAHIPVPLRLVDKRGVMIAGMGVYYQKQDSAAFRGNVQLVDTTQYIEADSLFSNRQKQYYELHGRVFIHDKKDSLSLVGDYARSDSSGHRLVRGHARLDKFKPDSPDTNYIQADVIAYHQKDSSYVFHARGNVIIWNKQFSSVSDSAAYVDSTGRFTLVDHAKAWHDSLQLTAPVIHVFIREDTVRRLVAYPSAFSVAQDSITSRLNQIAGDTLTAWFRKGEIDRMLVHPNARMIYFTHNEQNKPDGAISMNSDSLRILFRNGNIYKLKALSKISGRYLEESDDVGKMKLKGFAWNPELRPAKPKGPLRPRLSPIPDHPPFPLPKRYRAWLATQHK